MMETLEREELCFPQLNNSCRKPLKRHAENTFLYILLSCIAVITVTFNLLVIIAVFHFRKLQTPTNLLLLSLAVSDFLVGLLLMPIQITEIGGCLVFGSFGCAMFNYASYIITSASVGNMVLISVDRYVAICQPLSYPMKVTRRRVQVCICLCWGSSVFYNGMILKENIEDPEKHNPCYGECIYLIDLLPGALDTILTFIAPVTIIIVLYMRVFLVAVSQARAMRSQITAITMKGSVCITAKKSEKKAATALGGVVIVFLFSFCPYFCLSLIGENIENEAESILGTWLLYINSCINPIIYALFYPWFRKSVKLILTLNILRHKSCDINPVDRGF
ncbi:trace amine-associated receptor 13c-like [Cyprinodon tularosa]|uniref:trace amine-associated receptor 13c-like n=1 Tax=Cyprinodon tularosa TaxID=77115 RepID=UPI0018E1E77F|nr:trace amine-associated receptor 13c-like [Cyprinodon tularosa]